MKKKRSDPKPPRPKSLAKLLASYAQSGSYRACARECGWSESSARRAIREAGIMRPWPAPLSRAELAQIREEYERGTSLRRLAELHKRGAETLANVLRADGVVIRARGGRPVVRGEA